MTIIVIINTVIIITLTIIIIITIVIITLNSYDKLLVKPIYSLKKLK